MTFTTKLETAIERAVIIVFALPAPPDADGIADLKYVLGVADHLRKILKGTR
jgi:UDPglucose 6-dehydrogenase